MSRIETKFVKFLESIKFDDKVGKEFWFEYYDERYDKESNDSEFDIWIAIE